MLNVKAPSSRLEQYIIVHVCTLCILATWYLGGGSTGSYIAITALGSIGAIFLIFGCMHSLATRQAPLKTFAPLVPLLVFDALAVVSIFHPSFRLESIEGARMLIPLQPQPQGPSCARPDFALQELCLFNAIVLSALNLLFFVRRRRLLVSLFLVLTANAFALAVFGTLQKLIGANGIFLGQISSPNPTYFSSFIYHNHWGAYIILALAMCVGLLFNVKLDSSHRDLWHSPIPAACVAVFLLAVTIPLSGARACTVLSILLLGGALIWGFRRSSRHAHETGRSPAVPRLLLITTVIVCCLLTCLLARDVITTRVADTRTQLAQIREQGGMGSRSILYQDTFRMFSDRPWFGWGLGSYGTVFRSYNTQVSLGDNLPVYYEYAHSDWLQLLAETGIAGTVSYLTLLVLPLIRLVRKRIRATTGFLLAGCGIILLYAFIEFPFGNPAVTLHFWVTFFAAIRWVRLDSSAPQSCSRSFSSP
ncbi:MAG: O-antigen ligase family protein [Nibricoccus sp.]